MRGEKTLRRVLPSNVLGAGSRWRVQLRRSAPSATDSEPGSNGSRAVLRRNSSSVGTTRSERRLPPGLPVPWGPSSGLSPLSSSFRAPPMKLLLKSAKFAALVLGLTASATAQVAPWTQLTLSVNPATRERPATATDGNVLYLYGGQSGTTTSTYANLMAFNGTAWTTISATGTACGPRAGAVMAWDSARGKLVVFSGNGAAGVWATLRHDHLGMGFGQRLVPEVPGDGARQPLARRRQRLRPRSRRRVPRRQRQDHSELRHRLHLERDLGLGRHELDPAHQHGPHGPERCARLPLGHPRPDLLRRHDRHRRPERRGHVQVRRRDQHVVASRSPPRSPRAMSSAPRRRDSTRRTRTTTRSRARS
jgi:hypothetical protein